MLLMKTTIDLPEDLLRRTKVAATESGSTVRSFVIEGLEKVLRGQNPGNGPDDKARSALRRLQKGYRLGGKMLSREECHGR